VRAPVNSPIKPWERHSTIARCLVCIALVALAATATAVTTADAPRWADPGKTLRVSMDGEEAGFDPQGVGDVYSFTVVSAIFEAPYQYDYYGGARIVPRTAAAMPDISADGRTWRIRLKSGIHFSDDAAFNGRPRELTAQDYVYSWKRLLDPRMRSPNSEIFADRLAGAREAIDKAVKTGRFDYGAEIAGLRASDRYTIELTLPAPDYTLLPYLTGSALGAVAREVVEAYGDMGGRVMEHPVGTGPFRLVEWRRGQKIVLEANSSYREELFPSPPPDADATARAIAKSMAGKRLPRVGRVELTIIEPPQPLLLAFNSGALDLMDLPFELASKALDSKGGLLPAYASQGVAAQRVTDLYVGYLYFNMDDPIVGGTAPAQLALRRAFIMSYDVVQEISVIRNGQGRVATQPIPPGVDGHVPGLDVRPPYDPAAARALLDKFGYRDRDGDGWRELPDGRPLVIRIGTTPEDRERDDLIRKNMQAIGVRIEFVNRKWAELNKMAQEGQLQVWLLGAYATTGDAMMLALYGPNAGNGNLARFRDAEFDTLYRKSKLVATDAQRQHIYEQMARIVGVLNPWGLRIYAIRTALVRSWVSGYLRNPHFLQAWRFVDIDPIAQRTGRTVQ
jgi:peptide/nickel transport system substrate-binding protein